MKKKHSSKVSRKNLDFNNFRKPSRKFSLKNVSPLPFPMNKFLLVPSCFTNFTDWLLQVKPMKTHPTFLAVSHSIVLKQQSQTFNEVRNRYEQWIKMDKTKDTPIKENGTLSVLKNKNDQKCVDSFTPKTFKIKIEETLTIQLFYQVKRCAAKGTLVGKAYEKENKYHVEKVESGRKLDGNSQTCADLRVSRYCETLMTSHANKCTSSCSSSIYDLNFLYAQVKIEEGTNKIIKIEEFNSLIRGEYFKFMDKNLLYLKDVEEDVKNLVHGDFEYSELSEARKMVSILQSVEFFHISMLTQRVLERNIFGEQKMSIKVGYNPDPLETKINFKINIVLHHIAQYHKVWDLPVTSISINPVNNNVFAVSHGQYFSDQPSYLGRVNLWNLKNIVTPERSINFECGVTCVAFSTECPYALLVSFLNGRLAIVSVLKNHPIHYINAETVTSLISPIWHAQWFNNDFGEEVIITCGRGQVMTYSKNTFEKRQLLLLARIEGYISHGVSIPKKKALTNKVNLSNDIFCFASIDRLRYLVGTDNGSIHQCSIDCTSGHLNSFQAHHGPVYHIKFHPDVPKVLLSVGIDYCVRVWALDLYEPLVTLPHSDDFVEEAEWSPQNPTIIVTIAGCTFSVWDLRKIVSEPSSTYKSINGNRFTTVKFLNGCTVICGDIYGSVLILGISNLNFSPIYKLEAFCKSINRILAGNNDLLEKLKKLGHPFDIEV